MTSSADLTLSSSLAGWGLRKVLLFTCRALSKNMPLRNWDTPDAHDVLPRGGHRTTGSVFMLFYECCLIVEICLIDLGIYYNLHFPTSFHLGCLLLWQAQWRQRTLLIVEQPVGSPQRPQWWHVILPVRNTNNNNRFNRQKQSTTIDQTCLFSSVTVWLFF